MQIVARSERVAMCNNARTENMIMSKGQRKLIEFALKYSDKWHSYSPDYHTVGLICATSNLGIIKLNEHGQFALKCKEKALRFLA